MHAEHPLDRLGRRHGAGVDAAEDLVQRLQGLGKDIVPILLDDTPVVRDLARYQWLDFREFVRMGRNRAIMKQVSVGARAGAVVGAFPMGPPGAVIGAALAYQLLHKAQAEGFGVEWDEEVERQIVTLLSSRFDGSAAPND